MTANRTGPGVGGGRQCRPLFSYSDWPGRAIVPEPLLYEADAILTDGPNICGIASASNP